MCALTMYVCVLVYAIQVELGGQFAHVCVNIVLEIKRRCVSSYEC